MNSEGISAMLKGIYSEQMLWLNRHACLLKVTSSEEEDSSAVTQWHSDRERERQRHDTERKTRNRKTERAR